MILKDKFLSQCASDIKIKLQQLQQQNPAVSLDELIQTATNTFYNREQEKEAKAQERERRKEIRHAQMLAALQGSPMAHPDSLKDKARGKCLIRRQAGHWAKELRTVTSLLEQLATNAINWDVGRHSALGTQEPQGQAPSLPSPRFNRTEAPTPASPPVTDNRHVPWLEPRVQLDVLQCYSLKSPDPRLLPQNPKVCSVHLFIFCYLTYRVIIIIFLNSICMH